MKEAERGRRKKEEGLRKRRVRRTSKDKNEDKKE